MTGAILSDGTILAMVQREQLIIRPFNEQHVQPSSYDLTLGGDCPLILEPGMFWLTTTAEWVELPANIQGQVHGRSSVGRLGVQVHFTAGLIDPGFKGQITLECMAFAQQQTFYPGDRIAQITFHWLDASALHPYNGHYQNQHGTTPSRFEHAQPINECQFDPDHLYHQHAGHGSVR